MRQTPSALMLFAAGFGTRMGALTAERPKPLLTVGGQTLIDHALDIADAAGIQNKVVNLHYHGEQIARHLAHRVGISLSWERAEILETGGGLRAALPLLGKGPVYTLNPDVVWTGLNPLTQLRDAWNPIAMDALLLLLPVKSVRGRVGPADFALAPDGRITRAGSTGQHLYIGAQIIHTGGLAAIPDVAFSVNRLWDQMIADNRAYGLIYPGDWCDVGTPQGLIDAEILLASHHV
ncbi:MAG: nucleotidyltransferase family protein [Rhodoferax sp.]|nr:nucleotidyltransferase family protein [Pseudorhodobacter sp.]